MRLIDADKLIEMYELCADMFSDEELKGAETVMNWIQEVEQEPCDDVISRQMAIDAIEKISLGQTDVVKVAMMAEAYMKKLPSVNPQKSEDKE